MFFLREEKTFANERRLVHRADDLSARSPTHDRHGGVGDIARLPDARSRTTSPRADSATSTSPTRSSSRTRRSGRDEAVQKLSAKSVEVGRYDLVLHPSHLWLTIHESVAHPTELDRAHRLRGELRRHELRRAAGESARHAQVRLRAS